MSLPLYLLLYLYATSVLLSYFSLYVEQYQNTMKKTMYVICIEINLHPLCVYIPFMAISVMPQGVV